MITHVVGKSLALEQFAQPKLKKYARNNLVRNMSMRVVFVTRKERKHCNYSAQ